ncbi:MAG: energy-coupling factor transporter transmembrane protein EcfT [Opitutae bacterium]|nr:energy-coupling factor transporter transmembrane protein EcfT [Opitutae bacterium]
MTLLSVSILATIHPARLSLLRLISDTRLVLAMLAMVVLLRAVTIPGTPLAGLDNLHFSRQGLVMGLIFAWRVMLVVVGGMLLMATTRTRALRAAVAWFLKPLPGVPARRTALMMGLVVRFIPEIVHQYGEIRDAQRARGIESCRNPVRRLSCLTTGLMRRTLLRADRLALAMTARGYTEGGGELPLAAGPGDGALLALAAGICLAAIVW